MRARDSSHRTMRLWWPISRCSRIDGWPKPSSVPGHVHGGIVAAIFDELLGFTQSLSGRQGMTGRLTISYRSPTPLHTELRYESRIESVRGRKIMCTGQLYAGDTLCAEAEGLFIS